MAILQKLKSLLGFDDSGSERGDSQEVGVTVEREREGMDEHEESAAATDLSPVDDGETVVADTDAAASTDSMTEPSDVPHKSAEPAEAVGPNQSDTTPTDRKTPDDGVLDEPSADADAAPEDTDDLDPEPDGAAEPEPDGAAEPESEPEPEPESESEPESATPSEPEPATDDTPAADGEPTADDDLAEGEPSEPVDVIKGIGPAYADRMANAGVETVADLAAADADELEAETDISAKRIQGWIDRAKVR